MFNTLEEVYSKIGWPKEAIWNELQPIDSSLSIVAEVDGNVAGFYILKIELYSIFFVQFPSQLVRAYLKIDKYHNSYRSNFKI